MDEQKKKFEVHIEYEDDFDSWLAENDEKLARQKREALQLKKEQEAQADIRRRRIAEEQENAAKAALGSIPSQKAPATEESAGSASPSSNGVGAPSQTAQGPDSSGEPITKEPRDVPISKRPPAGAGQPADIPVSHRDVVKNFVLQLDENAIENPTETESVKPDDKSIYFAARRPSRAQIEARRVRESALLEEKNAKKREKEKKRAKEVRQVNRLRRLLVLIIVVLVTSLTSLYAISCINDILALSRSDKLITVKINKGDGYEEIIDTLKKEQLIEHPEFCKFFTKFRGFDKKEYINGIYYLTADMGVEGMLNEMRGNQTSDETIRLYFPEGWTIRQIAKKLAENNVCPEEYIYVALREGEFDFGFMKDVPSKKGRYFKLEGYVFPDTYDFFVSSKQNGMGENPTSVLRKFFMNYESKWSDVYQQRADELGLTMDEVITIASIIQKEAANEEQMKQISSVIHNRLNDRANFPTLGCDSTKNYVSTYLSEVIGESAASQLSEYYDTNGVLSGLPAGPICNPGVAAIEAALNPDDTDYYYFCHNDAGKIYLAETYSEFQRNWNQVLKDNDAS